MEALVDEVVFLIRSQIAAVFGNLVLVIPATFLLDVLWMTIVGHHIVDAHKAQTLLGSVSPLSASWFDRSSVSARSAAFDARSAAARAASIRSSERATNVSASCRA